MKQIVLTIALATGAGEAGACPALDALAERYGISFSGFDKPIPAATGPAAAQGERLRLPIPDAGMVSDGFRHMLLFDTATRKAWILRTGGLAGVHEWYGPVDVGDARLEDCRRTREAGQSGHGAQRGRTG